MKLVRFGVSMEERLLGEFDNLLDKKGYANRSEALRDLVRRCLIGQEQQDLSADAIGVISFVYDHERRELSHRLTRLGHSRLGKVISSMHVHLDATNCLEIIVVQGTFGEIQELADQILSIRGVLHGELMLAPRLPNQES